MQVQAIIRAALRCHQRGVRVQPEIMVSLVIEAQEMRMAKQLVDYAFKGVFEEVKATVGHKIGTMLETPSLDDSGVGELLRIAVDKARRARPDIKLGICAGEHGGDPASIAFVEKLKLDYVSCSPFRVQIARLAAGQRQAKSKG